MSGNSGSSHISSTSAFQTHKLHLRCLSGVQLDWWRCCCQQSGNLWFLVFYFGLFCFLGGDLFRAQTDHKFSSGQTNPKCSSNILALKLVDHFRLDFEQITFPFYVTMLPFPYKIFLHFWTRVWCHPSLILIDFEHLWMNASSLFPDAWLSEDIGRTWQVSFSLEPEEFQFFAQKSFLAWKLWQTYVAITQAIKEVQSGGKAAGRVTFTVSDSWL